MCALGNSSVVTADDQSPKLPVTQAASAEKNAGQAPYGTPTRIDGRQILPDSTAPPGTTLSDVRRFEQIEGQGLDNACYPDAEHYLAEYLYQHPAACLWEMDTARQLIGTAPVPAIPPDAIKLPAPSGDDDTEELQRIINDNAGGAVYGSGTYQINRLVIRVPIDIFDMPMYPTSDADTVVIVASPDVRLFNSPIDARGSAVTSTGYRVQDLSLIHISEPTRPY